MVFLKSVPLSKCFIFRLLWFLSNNLMVMLCCLWKSLHIHWLSASVAGFCCFHVYVPCLGIPLLSSILPSFLPFPLQNFWQHDSNGYHLQSDMIWAAQAFCQNTSPLMQSAHVTSAGLQNFIPAMHISKTERHSDALWQSFKGKMLQIANFCNYKE